MSDHDLRARSRLDARKRKLLLVCLSHLLLSKPLHIPVTLATLRPTRLKFLFPYPPAPSLAPLVATSFLNAPPSMSPHPEPGGSRITRRYLAMLGHADCKWAFRFTATEIYLLSKILELPNPLITERGYHASAVKAFALLCAHLRSPDTQWALVTRYNRPQSAISEIVNETATFINDHWGHLLHWDSSGLVHPLRLREYANALRDFGAPCNTIFGFIDCTIRQTCHPCMDQQLVYTGYKKCHGMKYQGVILPNGLIGHLSGPFRAPQNDAGVLAESKLLEYLEAHAIQPGSAPGDPPQQHFFQVYGDLAYRVSPVMISPYHGVGEHMVEQRVWNTAMGGIRISVEHGFGLVVQDWPQLNCYWRQCVWGTRCGVMYRTARRYDCEPPTLEEYFHSGGHHD